MLGTLIYNVSDPALFFQVSMQQIKKKEVDLKKKLS